MRAEVGELGGHSHKMNVERAGDCEKVGIEVEDSVAAGGAGSWETGPSPQSG